MATAGALLLTLCLGVYLSNSKKLVNRALVAFLLSGFLWLLSNLLANLSTTAGASLFFTRSALVGAALIPLAFLSFAVLYTGRRRYTPGYFALIAILPLITILFTPTDWNISSAQAHGKNAQAGPIYLLLIAILLSYFAYGLYALLKFYKRATALEKAQLQYIFAGVIITLIPGLITNGILPVIGSSGSSAYGPVTVVGFSLLTTVAIVRHRLLDIRLVVARALAYALVLGSLAAIFAAALFSLTSVFFSGTSISTGAKVAYIIIALLLAFIYQPLKRIFDRWTNRIFYQDAYDPQLMLDELNSVLVANIELQKLLQKSAATIASNIKAEYCLIGIKETDDFPARAFGTVKPEFAQERMDAIRPLTPYFTKHKVIITDDLDDKHEKLRSILQQNSIAILARLLTHSGGIGYIVLGYKKSGNPYSKQDIRILDIIADELVIAVQNSLRFEEIQHFNITLQQKVEEATRQLRHANHRLRELDATKDEFISMASHQLRTPLTTIKGYLSMVLEGDVGPVNKNEKQMIQQAFDSAERMVYLIADLLNVSRLQSGKFVIENKPTDLAKMVEGEVAQLKETAEHHNLKLIYKKPSKFPLLNLDETKIRQVIMNFLDNAIYYTPAGGSIEVALEATDEAVSYTVTDTGLGVPKAEQHHLFSKFYRAGNARKMRPDGTGLGLFMAKKVIVAQGGAIIFKSTEGKGSTFGFSFPRATVELKDKLPQKPVAEAVVA